MQSILACVWWIAAFSALAQNNMRDFNYKSVWSYTSLAITVGFWVYWYITLVGKLHAAGCIS